MRVEREGAEVDSLIEELKQLSDSADAAALTKDANFEESRDILTEFLSSVERLLMTAQTARDSQCLHRLRRDCIDILQRATLTQRGIDPETDQVDAFVSRRALSSCLKKQVEQSKQALDNAAGGPEFDLIEAIYETTIALRGREHLEGNSGLLNNFYLTLCFLCCF